MDIHEECDNVGKLSAEDCDCPNCLIGNNSRSSDCSALDILRIRSLIADKEMLISRANNDLAVGGYWLGDYEGWAREIQGEIDAILKQNSKGNPQS